MGEDEEDDDDEDDDDDDGDDNYVNYTWCFIPFSFFLETYQLLCRPF